MWEMNHQIHEIYAKVLGDDRLARASLARDLRVIGRARLGLGHVETARAAYRASLAQRPTAGGLAWALLLALPGSNEPMRRIAARRRRRSTVIS
jgi:hypothetical protein